MPNYYEILGVDRGAEQEVIGAAYRAMMRRYHPDTFTGLKAEGERRAKQLNEAYSTLRDSDRRQAYDQTLGPVPPPTSPVRDTLPGPSSLSTRRTGLLVGGLAVVVVLVVLTYSRRNESPTTIPTTSSTHTAAYAPVPRQVATPTLAPATLAECKGMDCRVMTPFGWAGIEAGVTIDSAQAASGLKLRDDGHYTEVGDGTCLAYEVIGGPKNLQMLVESGVVTTVEAYLDSSAPIFMTDRGVKLGDSEAAVRKAYVELKQLPDIYSEPPDKKLFYFEPGGERGVKFSINGGKVTGISVGSSSIEYVEGCL